MLICYSSKKTLIHTTERVGRVIGDSAGRVGPQGSCVSSLAGVQSWELLRVVVSCALFVLLSKRFIYLAAPSLSCSLQGLLVEACAFLVVAGIEPRPPALGAQSLSH